MKDLPDYENEPELTARLKGLLKHASGYIDSAPREQKLELLILLENWLGVDRRRHPRKACFVSVTVGGSSESTAFVRNISTGGMFIETSAPCSSGEHIQLTLLIPNQKEDVEITGEIVSKTPEGIGVRFTTPPSKELQEMIESL